MKLTQAIIDARANGDLYTDIKDLTLTSLC